ncbi:MAG: GNAT family N-acetyltransferase [Patescibacteria group bacterium]|jgi:predicted GNAT family N-acyltransferase
MGQTILKIADGNKDIADAQSVRYDVFTEEQGIEHEADADGLDSDSDHVLAYQDGDPVGTVRLRYIEPDIAKIERFAVKSKLRGQGLGKLIMQKALDHLKSKNIIEIVLDSQSHTKGFYEKFGFEQFGKEFEEVGIPHVKMRKTIS